MRGMVSVYQAECSGADSPEMSIDLLDCGRYAGLCQPARPRRGGFEALTPARLQGSESLVLWRFRFRRYSK